MELHGGFSLEHMDIEGLTIQCLYLENRARTVFTTWMNEWINLKDREIFYVLVHSQNAYKSWSQIRFKWGSRNSCGCLLWVTVASILGSSSTKVQSCWGLTQGIRCAVQQLNYCAMTPVSNRNLLFSYLGYILEWW